MQPEMQIILSGMLTFGVPLAFAFRELHELRRPNKGSGGGGPAPDPITPTPAPKPLPDCLIPKLGPRVRELEDA